MAVKTGIVMKTDRNKAYIMTRNGEFLNVKLQGSTPEIGSEYTGELIVKGKRLFNFRHVAAAAALLMVLLSAGGAYAYNIPVSTVTISSNPVVQLKSNIFNRVIEVSSPDENTNQLINSMNLKNTSMEKAVTSVAVEVKKKSGSTEPVPIDIQGKKVDTSGIKKNLETQSIDYKIKDSVQEKKDDTQKIKNDKDNKSSGNKQNISNKKINNNE